MKIKKIKKIEHSDNVYNLRIEDNHNYFVNNLCVSNCHQSKAKSYLKILEIRLGKLDEKMTDAQKEEMKKLLDDFGKGQLTDANDITNRIKNILWHNHIRI